MQLADAEPICIQNRHDRGLGDVHADLAHGELAVSALDGSALDRLVTECWGACAPATWNRHVATLRSFTAHAQRRGWLTVDPAAVLERRREPDDRTKAIAESSLERLFRRSDVGVREKCLWRLLYETAARAEEVLSSNVDDLDLENKRLRVRRKGGDADWLHFQSGSARLLPRAIGGPDRSSWPIDAPGPARTPAAVDLCPVTGRGRLTAVLRASRVPVQAGLAQDHQPGLDAAPAAPLRPHPPGRGRGQPATADGQERPPEPSVAPALRPAERRRRRCDDSCARSGPAPDMSFRSLMPIGALHGRRRADAPTRDHS